MKHIVEEWHQNICDSALWSFYFDPSRNKFILGGIYDGQSHRLHQILAENRKEEPEALAEYMDVLADLDVVITYNGRHFDIPFIDTRLKKHAMTSTLSCSYLYDLDLYQVLRGFSPIRRFVPNLKQKTVEDYTAKEKAFFDEQAGIIAETLVDGQPCPVCGATDHPHPAHKSPNAPTEATLKKAKKLI